MTHTLDGPGPGPHPPQTRRYSIAEASRATGVTIDTLRYYERAGILPDIARTDGGRRVYCDDDLGWIVFVRRLRSTGMSMRRIEHYAAMVRVGEGTIAERRAVLEDHRATVAAAIEELTGALTVLDSKIAHYEAAEQGIDVSCRTTPMHHVSQLG